MLVLVVAVVLERRMGVDGVETGPIGPALAGIGIGLGALLFAARSTTQGTPRGRGSSPASPARRSASRVLASACSARRERAWTRRCATALPVYAEGVALLVAGLRS